MSQPPQDELQHSDSPNHSRSSTPRRILSSTSFRERTPNAGTSDLNAEDTKRKMKSTTSVVNPAGNVSATRVRFMSKEDVTVVDEPVVLETTPRASTSKESSVRRSMERPEETSSQAGSMTSYASRVWIQFENVRNYIYRSRDIKRENVSTEKAEEVPRPDTIDKFVQTERLHKRTSSFGLFLRSEDDSSFWSPENAALLIGVIVATIVAFVLAILVVLKYKKNNSIGQIEHQTEISPSKIDVRYSSERHYH